MSITIYHKMWGMVSIYPLLTQIRVVAEGLG
jgi:hypothetical protein